MTALDRMLSKVGDLGLRRRVLKSLEYLEVQADENVLDCGCGEGFYTPLVYVLKRSKNTR